ncbi:hypothetical protein EB796_022024 [Bugula neritina]|uniref:Uncharacterized protein n=1 Tax=Bugula neritina TaxID=10212 RepID=A0A7J7J1V5_BUGNE|nr:hypothetical protein EB796_022024 [Bugula neritina]
MSAHSDSLSASASCSEEFISSTPSSDGLPSRSTSVANSCFSELSGTTTAQLSSCSSPDELKSKVDDFSEEIFDDLYASDSMFNEDISEVFPSVSGQSVNVEKFIDLNCWTSSQTPFSPSNLYSSPAAKYVVKSCLTTFYI